MFCDFIVKMVTVG